MTLRRAGKMHHLGIGATHARTRVLAIADDHHVTVTDLATGEVLSTHLIQPDKTYWRNQNKEPGRKPPAETDAASDARTSLLAPESRAPGARSRVIISAVATKRSYGTGQLYEKHGSYYGRWWTLDGRQPNRRIG